MLPVSEIFAVYDLKKKKIDLVAAYCYVIETMKDTAVLKAFCLSEKAVPSIAKQTTLQSVSGEDSRRSTIKNWQAAKCVGFYTFVIVCSGIIANVL